MKERTKTVDRHPKRDSIRFNYNFDFVQFNNISDYEIGVA